MLALLYSRFVLYLGSSLSHTLMMVRLKVMRRQLIICDVKEGEKYISSCSVTYDFRFQSGDYHANGYVTQHQDV